MAAYYAMLMQTTGSTATVQPIAVVGSNGVITSEAIGRALQFVAAEQVAANQAGNGVRYVVSMPISPGVWSQDEALGWVKCYEANVPVSEAAGNDYKPYVMPNLPNVIMAEAMGPTGSFYPYSNVGPNGTPIVVPSYGMGTSGASLRGAAWLTKPEFQARF